jgi:hypothetical protein
MLNWNLLAVLVFWGPEAVFLPVFFLPAKQNTAEITPTTNTNTPPAAAPIMMTRFELEDSGAGVVSGEGGGAGGAAVVTGGAAVLAGCAAVVTFAEVTALLVLLAAELLVGTMACTTSVGEDTVVVLPTEFVLSCVFTALTVILCCTVVALAGLLSILISVTTSAVPAAASSRRSREKLFVTTVLGVSTVALITAFGVVQAVS